MWLLYPYGRHKPSRPDPICHCGCGHTHNALDLKVQSGDSCFGKKEEQGRAWWCYQVAKWSKKTIEGEAEPKICKAFVRVAWFPLKPEDICKVCGKLLVEGVVSPVGSRVPKNNPPNLANFSLTSLFTAILVLSVYSKWFCLGRRKNLSPGNRKFSSTDISPLHCW